MPALPAKKAPNLAKVYKSFEPKTIFKCKLACKINLKPKWFEKNFEPKLHFKADSSAEPIKPKWFYKSFEQSFIPVPACPAEPPRPKIKKRKARRLSAVKNLHIYTIVLTKNRNHHSSESKPLL